MKYTRKTFMSSLLTKREFKESKNRGEMEETAIIKWTDNTLCFYSSENKNRRALIDSIDFFKKSSNKFSMELMARNCWAFDIEFSDGGFVENKEYKISEFYK